MSGVQDSEPLFKCGVCTWKGTGSFCGRKIGVFRWEGGCFQKDTPPRFLWGKYTASESADSPKPPSNSTSNVAKCEPEPRIPQVNQERKPKNHNHLLYRGLKGTFNQNITLMTGHE